MNNPPHCGDCGREVLVGAAIGNVWRCEQCRIVQEFNPARREPAPTPPEVAE